MPSSAQDRSFAPGSLSKPFIFCAGIIPATGGLVILISWYAHFTTLLQLRPNFPPMQYNTALCILFSGAGLCAWNWRRPRLARALGSLVAILAGLTLYEYLCGFDFHVDQLFFHPYITVQTSQPGRMAPASALCLSLIGLALVFAGLGGEIKWRAMAIGTMGSTVVTVCGVAVLGYAIDLPGTYGWGQLTLIALHTACALALLGAGVFAIAWNLEQKTEGLAPRWLPLPVGVAIIAASLVFFQALESRQRHEIDLAIKTNSDGVANIVSVRMEARIHSLERMAKRWDFSGRPAQAEWENDVKNYLTDAPDFQAIEWIDPSHLVRWIVPLAGNEYKLNQDFTKEQRRRTAVEMSLNLREPAMTRVVELSRGGFGFVIYVPLFMGDTFDGWIAGVFKAQPLFDRYLPAPVASGYAVSISDGGETFYKRYPEPKPSNKNWTVATTVDQRGGAWTVSVWPTRALVAQMNSSLPKMVLAAGLALSVLLALTVYLAQNSSAQALKTAVLNRELQAALDEVHTLSGLLPICAGCKRIRDDSGYWNGIERYISKHSDASFSHGICPECAHKFYEAEGMEVPEDILKAVEKHHYD